MTCINDKRNEEPAFYVVQFLELPIEDIDPYVIIPYNWVIIRSKKTTQKTIIAYPNDEDPDITRDRVKRKEIWVNDWTFYMAILKYESHTYKDAENWIKTRCNYVPSVEPESRATVTQPKLMLKRISHSANESHSFEINGIELPKMKEQTDRKRLKRNETGQSSSTVRNNASQSKQTALPTPKEQSDTKRLKRDEVAQSSNMAYSDANVQPGCSRWGQSILIQDTRPIECLASITQTKLHEQKLENTKQTREIAAACRKSSSSQPKSALQPEPVLEAPIPVATSMEMSRNDLGPGTDDVLYTKSPSHRLLNSSKKSTHLHNHTNGALSSILTQKPSSKITSRNPAIAAQNPSNLINLASETRNRLQDSSQVLEMHTGDPTAASKRITNSTPKIQQVARVHVERYQDVAPVDRRNIPENITNVAPVSQNVTSSAQKQGNYQQELVRGSTDNNKPNSAIRGKTLSIRQNTTQQSQPNQQELQQKSEGPVISIGISIKPKNNSQIVSLQEGTNKTPPAIVSNILDPIRQVITSQDEQQMNVSQNESLPIVENIGNVMDIVCQTDECTLENPLTTSDSNADHEFSTNDPHVDAANNVICTKIASNSSSNKPTVAQYSTLPNHQTHHRAVVEQQMVDIVAAFFSQMEPELRHHTCEMFNNLRNSIRKTADSCTSLLNAVERFHTLGNSVISNPSPSQASEERHTELTARSDSTNENQSINNTVNRALKKEYINSWQFLLPPEYDPNDTRWTLKYRTNLPELNLQEIIPGSDIYVSYEMLMYSQQASKNCKSLARRLLVEVFNRPALGVCLTMTEEAQVSDNDDCDVRPKLDKNALMALLRFVMEQGLERGWKVVLRSILATLNNKMKIIRSKYSLSLKG